MYGTCLRILHTYVQQHNNNTLKSTVSILKAAEREALEDENKVQRVVKAPRWMIYRTPAWSGSNKAR